MEIHFWGAARTVTGSSHYLKVNGHTLLLDCGLFQGRRQDTYEVNRSFRFLPSEIDAVVLSHAHIDHSGNLPNLVKHGFEGPIFATNGTVSLCEHMLLDSGRIQESDVRFVNKKKILSGEPVIDPLYTEEDAESALGLFEGQLLDKPIEVVPGVQATWVEAGHILGSAAIVLDIEEKGKTTRLWFSGDIGRPYMPILRDPVMPSNADYLLMECTYGDKPHPPYEEAFERLNLAVSRTLQRGGKVIIPAFAVGRTQELVYAFNQAMNSGDVPKVPVFVDSPLAVNVTDAFLRHPEYYDREARDILENGHRRSVLGFDMLTYIRSVEESKALNDRHDPMIIISASGMVENGRILHHLRNNIDDSKSMMLIVSWQAPYTLGRRLVEGAPVVRIFGEEFERRIQVETINGFSAHAGKDLLEDYALSLKGRVKDVFFVHGEARGADPLMESLSAQGMSNLHYPSRGTVFEV